MFVYLSVLLLLLVFGIRIDTIGIVDIIENQSRLQFHGNAVYINIIRTWYVYKHTSTHSHTYYIVRIVLYLIVKMQRASNIIWILDKTR